MGHPRNGLALFSLSDAGYGAVPEETPESARIGLRAVVTWRRAGNIGWNHGPRGRAKGSRTKDEWNERERLSRAEGV